MISFLNYGIQLKKKTIYYLDSPAVEFDIKSIKPYLGRYHNANDFLKDVSILLDDIE